MKPPAPIPRIPPAASPAPRPPPASQNPPWPPSSAASPPGSDPAALWIPRPEKPAAHSLFPDALSHPTASAPPPYPPRRCRHTHADAAGSASPRCRGQFYPDQKPCSRWQFRRAGPLGAVDPPTPHRSGPCPRIGPPPRPHTSPPPDSAAGSNGSAPCPTGTRRATADHAPRAAGAPSHHRNQEESYRA